MHPAPHTLAMIFRTLKPTRGDAGATSIGLSVPFLMAADGTLPDPLTMALTAALVSAAGLAVKTLWVGLAGGLRAYSRRAKKTATEGDDALGEVAKGIADAVDPEHADPVTPAPTEPPK